MPQFAQNQFPASPSGSRTTDADYDARPVRPAKADAGGNGDKAGERVEARRFLNPTTTVPKGTIVQAVLETALDSTRAGFARAIVSRDVYGFDGSRVLISKGSRLIGEYKADLTDGQSRALIQWDRLTRPDGVIINLDSPSADPLGRAGVKGKVNSHFFAKFGGAILQSALDVGSQVATNKIASGTVVYALPSLSGLRGATQSNGLVAQDKIQPTLTVKQGTSVSVFVARDLDFTSVEQ
jgi:type IV secretion system protein VirB10